MTPFEIALVVLIAAVLVALALFFGWRQVGLLNALRYDDKATGPQKRYFARQAARRLFGSLVLLVLAGLLIGSIFLDYEALQVPAVNGKLPDDVRQSFGLITFYWMTTLLVLMVVFFMAVMDLWATARYAHQQHKQLALDHQRELEAELARFRESRN